MPIGHGLAGPILLYFGVRLAILRPVNDHLFAAPKLSLVEI